MSPKTSRILVLCAVFASGCTATEVATLTVNWSIQKVDGTVLPCSTDFPNMLVHVQSYSDTLGANEEDITKLFDCSAGQGTWSLPLSGDMENPNRSGFSSTNVNGKYDVWVSQSEATGTVVRQSAFPTYYVDLTTGDKTVTSTLYENGGYYGLYWGLRSLATSGGFDCAQAAIDTVRLTITNKTTSVPAVTTYPCLQDEGRNIHEVGKIQGERRLVTIGPLQQGTYTAKVEGLLANGTVVGVTDPDNGNYPAAPEFTVRDKTDLNLPYEIYTILLTNR
jgi:hypothetical protein